MIRREDGKYCVYSHDGSRRLGCYDTEPEAQKRLKQVEYFKHIKSGKIPMADVKSCPDCCKNIPCDKHAPVPGTDKHKAISEQRHKDTMMLVAKKLDPKAEVRNRGNVVFPAASKKVKDNKDHFPINNENQARNALSRVAQYSSVPPWYSGSLEELKGAVQSAVKNKYPGIDVTKSKADTTVKSPPGNDPKVAQEGINVPSLKGTKDGDKVYAALANLSEEQHKAFASALVKQLQMQQEQLINAITLAEKLLDEGITPDEFAQLSAWTQYDILVQLMQ
jgi:hypothetical protein